MYKKVQNDEVYLQLRNMMQEKNERMEVHYERLLKLAYSLQHKTLDSFLITIFRSKLQSCLRVTTIGMKRKTLQHHKEATLVCEEGILKVEAINNL